MAAGLSQERLAETARISTEAVSALERGTRKAPHRQTLTLLSEALGLDSRQHEALSLAAVRPAQPRVRYPRAEAAYSPLLSAPAGLTSFVGRDHDVAAVLALCRTARLISIVGPGGVGKSRLALETARAAAPTFPDGVSIVALAPLLPHAPVLPTLAAALGIRDEGAVALEERILAAIGGRTVLLILDNCEHVLDELAPALEYLLAACAGLRVIATSRERLRIDGERIHRLRPLSIGHAVDVFIDRAAANGFDADREEDLSIAAEICDRLDRMPLAIELAASCSGVLAFEAILERLRERFPLPAKPTRSALPQHRSMQALVEWSYDRLEPNDALVFRQLAPFLGGCRLDDAQEVIGGNGLSKDDVLYGLFRLHEQSLVDADRAHVPRFAMLQTIRDFATSRLGSDERSALTRRFAMHYFSIVARADGDLRSARQETAIERISAESTNVFAALPHLRCDTGDVAVTGLAALGALSHYWLRTGTLTEGAEIYATVDFSQFSPSAELAAALTGASFVELNRRVFAKAHGYALQAREAARASGDRWFEIYAAIAEHTIAALSGTFRVAEPFEPFYREAVELGDPWLIGTAAYRMAELVEPGDDAAGNAYLEYALTCAETSGDAFAVQSIQLALAHSTTSRDPYRASEFVAAVWRQLGPAHFVRKSRCVECLAGIAVVLGRFDDAAFIAGVGLSLFRAIGAPEAARARLAAVARRLGPPHAAAVALGDQASDAEASERIASFLRSVARARAPKRRHSPGGPGTV